jgi:hypothetical protein
MAQQAHAKPADVTALDGHVLVEGPGGIVYSFTPDAAAETSDRLLAGAAKAKGQAYKDRLQRGLPM